ncbi:MAG: T9SS type A sorting domain-containing protein [Ignavibacteriales bacterium]|nr:T9SS type A sorting domain-containing protein [Ignavibacteriales bacterium]
MIFKSSTDNQTPKTYVLHQNFPNPFNPSTVIHYELPYTSYTRLTVYDLLGRIVATVVDAVMEKGDHAVTWNPKMAGGIYYYHLETKSVDNPSISYQTTKTMVFLK